MSNLSSPLQTKGVIPSQEIITKQYRVSFTESGATHSTQWFNDVHEAQASKWMRCEGAKIVVRESSPLGFKGDIEAQMRASFLKANGL